MNEERLPRKLIARAFGAVLSTPLSTSLPPSFFGDSDVLVDFSSFRSHRTRTAEKFGLHV